MLHDLVELLPERLQPFAKAVVAGLLGALAPFILAGLTTGEWDKAAIIGAVSAFLLGGAVRQTPNLPNNSRALEAADASELRDPPKDLAQAGLTGPERGTRRS
jgi:hypothetical protein